MCVICRVCDSVLEAVVLYFDKCWVIRRLMYLCWIARLHAVQFWCGSVHVAVFSGVFSSSFFFLSFYSPLQCYNFCQFVKVGDCNYRYATS